MTDLSFGEMIGTLFGAVIGVAIVFAIVLLDIACVFRRR